MSTSNARGRPLRRAAIALALLAAAGWCAWSAWSAERDRPRPPSSEGAPPGGAASPFDRFDADGVSLDFPGAQAVAVLASEPLLGPVVVSPDGEWIAAASGDAVLLWRGGHETPVARLANQPGPVRALAFRGDGQALLVGGAHAPEVGGGWLQLWLIRDGNLVAGQALDETACINALAFVPGTDLAVAGGVPVAAFTTDPDKKSQKRLQLLRLGPARIETVAEMAPDEVSPVWSLAVSPDGRTLAVLSDEGGLRVFNLGPKKAPIWPRLGMAALLTAAAALALGWSRLAMGRRFVPLPHGAGVLVFKEPKPRRLRWWLLGALIIAMVACEEAWLRALWGDRSRTLAAASLAAPRGLAFCDDGLLAVADGDRVRLWRRDGNGMAEGDALTGPRPLEAVKPAPAGPWLATLDDTGTVRYANAATRRVHRTVPGRQAALFAVAPDARHVLIRAEDSLVVLRLWSADGKEVRGNELAAALARNPHDPAALEARGRSHLRQARWAQAVNDLTDSLRHRPSKEAHWLRAMARLHLQEHAEAAWDMEAVVRADPNDALAHYHLGLMQIQTNELRAARASLDTAFRLDPGLAKAAGVEDKEKVP